MLAIPFLGASSFFITKGVIVEMGGRRWIGFSSALLELREPSLRAIVKLLGIVRVLRMSTMGRSVVSKNLNAILCAFAQTFKLNI